MPLALMLIKNLAGEVVGNVFNQVLDDAGDKPIGVAIAGASTKGVYIGGNVTATSWQKSMNNSFAGN